jgi:hypothetical protein
VGARSREGGDEWGTGKVDALALGDELLFVARSCGTVVAFEVASRAPRFVVRLPAHPLRGQEPVRLVPGQGFVALSTPSQLIVISSGAGNVRWHVPAVDANADVVLRVSRSTGAIARATLPRDLGREARLVLYDGRTGAPTHAATIRDAIEASDLWPRDAGPLPWPTPFGTLLRADEALVRYMSWLELAPRGALARRVPLTIAQTGTPVPSRFLDLGDVVLVSSNEGIEAFAATDD